MGICVRCKGEHVTIHRVDRRQHQRCIGGSPGFGGPDLALGARGNVFAMTQSTVGAGDDRLVASKLIPDGSAGTAFCTPAVTNSTGTPATTRPISLPNTDNKYFALALNRPLAEAATVTVHPRQRGFVQGRSLIDNVLEIEGFGQSHATAEADNPAIILFDIMAAFPSLSHHWLFMLFLIHISRDPRLRILLPRSPPDP